MLIVTIFFVLVVIVVMIIGGYFLLTEANKKIVSKNFIPKINYQFPELSIVGVLAENISAGVVVVDEKFSILFVNKSAKEIIGVVDKKEISIFDFIDNLGGKFDIMGQISESLKLHKVFNSDEIQIKEKLYKISVFPVEVGLPVEKKTLSMVIFHNVTTLHAVQEVRDQFTSMVVHELRAPLSGINKVSELLLSKDGSVDKNELEQYLKMINTDSTSMLDLVNDILDIAKLEAGKFEVKKEDKDIKKIIDNRLEFWRPSIENAKLKIGVSYDSELPSTVGVDESGIKQVLNNLISNAVKFTTTGGNINVFAFRHKPNTKISDDLMRLSTKPTVNIFNDKSFSNSDSLVIGVSDTSAGISSSGIKELFTKFKQLDNKSQTGQRGSGLGLFIAKGIVEGHGGSIGVASELGVGSVFYITLPL